MRFRVYNQDKFLTFEEVGNIFGCSPGNHGPATEPDSDLVYPSVAFWNRISGLPTYAPNKAKGSSILHPCMRIAHKILTSTIFCRSDSGTVLNQELYFLHGMVGHHHNDISMNGGAFIAQKLERVANSDDSEICCGGLITHLITASSLQVTIEEGEDVVEGLDRLNIEAFQRFHFIRPLPDGRYSWLVGPRHLPYTTLPDHQRTHVDHNTNWLFPVPPEEEQAGDQHQAPPQNIDERLDALTLRVDQNTQNIQGVQHTLNQLQQNLYGFFQHQGYNPYFGP